MRLKHIIPAVALLLLVSCSTPSNNQGSSEALKELFEQLNSGYNFTLESVNEGNTRRKLEVFDKYCYYYSYQTRVRKGESGAFYIENQGVQDFEIIDNEINILFHEGVKEGKIEVVESFTHDDRGSQFAHIPMSSFLGVDYRKFKKSNDTFVCTNKDVNRVFCYYTNNYYANWEKGNEEAYIDFSKSTTTISITETGFNVNFMPFVRNVGFEYTEDGSNLFVTKIGSTRNQIIDDYRANPKPMTKKTDYGFNQEKYVETFGNVVIPFSNKYSEYLDVVEYYADSAINIYDIEPGEGIVNDIKSQLTNEWKLDSEDSDYWTNNYGFTVYSYYRDSEIKLTVEGSEVTNTIEVYFVFGFCPVDLEETEDGKILRPNGYFVGQLYRKLGEEAIEGGEAINEHFVSRGADELMPDFLKYDSLSPVLRDYSENAVLQETFALQGYFLAAYYEITFSNVTSSNVSRVAKSLRDDFSKISFYSDVILNETDYSLQVNPDMDAFAEDGSFPMSVVGGTILDEQENINGYKLIAISLIPMEN